MEYTEEMMMNAATEDGAYSVNSKHHKAVKYQSLTYREIENSVEENRNRN